MNQLEMFQNKFNVIRDTLFTEYNKFCNIFSITDNEPKSLKVLNYLEVVDDNYYEVLTKKEIIESSILAQHYYSSEEELKTLNKEFSFYLSMYLGKYRTSLEDIKNYAIKKNITTVQIDELINKIKVFHDKYKVNTGGIKGHYSNEEYSFFNVDISNMKEIK